MGKPVICEEHSHYQRHKKQSVPASPLYLYDLDQWVKLYFHKFQSSYSLSQARIWEYNA